LHWNAAANSGRLLTVPLTRKRGGESGSEVDHEAQDLVGLLLAPRLPLRDEELLVLGEAAGELRGGVLAQRAVGAEGVPRPAEVGDVLAVGQRPR
jgi:hypothetical protein